MGNLKKLEKNISGPLSPIYPVQTSLNSIQPCQCIANIECSMKPRKEKKFPQYGKIVNEIFYFPIVGGFFFFQCRKQEIGQRAIVFFSIFLHFSHACGIFFWFYATLDIGDALAWSSRVEIRLDGINCAERTRDIFSDFSRFPILQEIFYFRSRMEILDRVGNLFFPR